MKDSSNITTRVAFKDLSCEHTCSAIDDREASMLKHQILAEIHRSSAPAWVSEELQRILDCYMCQHALMRRRGIFDDLGAYEIFSHRPRGQEPLSAKIH